MLALHWVHRSWLPPPPAAWQLPALAWPHLWRRWRSHWSWLTVRWWWPPETQLVSVAAQFFKCLAPALAYTHFHCWWVWQPNFSNVWHQIHTYAACNYVSRSRRMKPSWQYRQKTEVHVTLLQCRLHCHRCAGHGRCWPRHWRWWVGLHREAFWRCLH